MLGAFLKTGGEELCGVTSRKARLLIAEVGETYTRATVVEDPSSLAQLALEATKRVSSKLLADHEALRSLERKAARDALNHGSLTEEKEKALEDARKAREKLVKEVSALCDALDIDPPVLLDGDDSEEEDDKGELSLWTAERGSRSESAGAYDDDAARTFYEDYPNILDVVPAPALGLDPAKVAELQAKRESIRALWRGAKTLAGAEAEGLENASTVVAEDNDDVVEPTVEDNEPRDAVGLLLTEELPACHSRDRADALALKFCEGLATGKARKRLVKALYACPRTALDLLPQYSRIAAVVSQAYSDVGELLCQELAREFRWLFKGKKLHNLEGKLRNARFLGELSKFRVAPPHLVFVHCKRCLEDFSGHSVDYCCSLIETCGGFLLRSAPTKERTARILQSMSKMKSAKPLNQRDAALVSYACDRANPPEKQAVVLKPRTELYQFIEWLVMIRLCDGTDKNVESVIRALRSLPWDTNEASLIAKFVLKLARSKADAVPLAADCLAGLHQFRPEVSARVVDQILDEFDEGVSTPPPLRALRTAQRLVAYASLLGECYNFSLLSSAHVFGIVERLLGRGHAVTPGFEAHMAYRAAKASEDARKKIEKRRADALMAERSDEDESEEESDGEDIDEAARIASALYRLDEGIDVDPRVPCPGDPPSCFLRITLCCALLKTAAPCLLASITTHGPLESALDDIQRSFFAKPSAPLGPRYALLDALEDVRRHRRALQASWPRRARQARRRNRPPPPKVPDHIFALRKGWAAADDACRARLAANRARLMLQHRPVAEEPQGVEGQRRSDIEEDDSGDEDEDEAATASESESGSSSDSEESDDDGEEEESKAVNEDDAAEEEEEDDDEDEEKPPEKSFDDLAFERAFEKTMLDDAAAQRRRVIAGADSMATPSMLRRFDGQSLAKSPFGGMANFKMLKRGARGRPEARELHVPETTNFAAQVRRNKEARDAEDRSLKEATYKLAARQDEDPDYSRGPPQQRNLGRRW